MNNMLDGLRKLSFAALAMFIVLMLGSRCLSMLCSYGGFVNLACMAVLVSLCLGAVLESMQRGFKAGGVILLAGIVLNIMYFFGII